MHGKEEQLIMGKVYWITGLSGAGKTTIGTKLFNYLREKKDNVVLLDGDILRGVFQIYDYSSEGRKSLAFQYSRLCRMLSKQGIDVVICTIAMYEDVRIWNRKNIDGYVEIYLEVSMDELIRRDQKGLYTKAAKNEEENVAGVNMQVELPQNPDICIQNYGEISPDNAFITIVNYLEASNEGKEDKLLSADSLHNIDNTAIDNICNILKCKKDEIGKVCILQAGLTNISFLFEVNNKKYVYRSAGSKSAKNLVDRKTEVYAQIIAKEKMIDSSVIYIHEDGWKISSFIEKKEFSMTQNDLDLEMGMRFLRDLHKVIPKEHIREFNCYEDGIFLFNQATATRVDLREQYQELVKKVQKVYKFAEEEATEYNIKKVLCHNDVYEANYIYDGCNLYLIDWEYAGLNDPANDLACILCRDNFSDEQIQRYMKAYYAHSPLQYEERHMYAYIVLCAFYWFCWGLYKGKSDNDVGFFYEHAYENLLRFIDPVLLMYEDEKK